MDLPNTNLQNVHLIKSYFYQTDIASNHRLTVHLSHYHYLLSSVNICCCNFDELLNITSEQCRSTRFHCQRLSLKASTPSHPHYMIKSGQCIRSWRGSLDRLPPSSSRSLSRQQERARERVEWRDRLSRIVPYAASILRREGAKG